MTIEAQLPDGRILEFPDGTSQSVIKAAAQRILANPLAGRTTAELESFKSAPMSVGNYAKDIGAGLFGAGKSFVDFFGTGSELSKGLGEAHDYLQQSLTPERKEEIARRNELQDRAARSGSLFQEAKAFVGGVAEAPFESLAQAVGSSAPAILAGIVALPIDAPIALGLGVATITKLAVGAMQGVGEMKGGVHDVVKAEYMRQGRSEPEAEKLAIQSSEYARMTAFQTGGAALLGALDAVTGVEPSVGKAMRKVSPTGQLTQEAMEAGFGALKKEPIKAPTYKGQLLKGIAEEAPLEGAQGAFGQYGENVAAQQAGADVTPMQGVLGAGLRDATVGALFGGVGSPLGMKSARQDFSTDQFLRQAKDIQEQDKQAADALKEQQETRAKTEGNLNVPKMLALPAPAKAAEAEKDPLYNPVGRVTEDELGKAIGDNTVVNYLNKYRKDNNLPKLKTYSIEDIKDAMTAQNPEGEAGALNAILAYKTNYQNETYTPTDIQNRAVQKNVATGTKGWNDFLTRATGKSDLNTMTQPELHSVATALDALERTGKEEQLVLPEGSNATRFTQEQYDAGVTAALLGEKPVTLDEALKRVQTQKGVDSDQSAERILRTAASNDDLVIEKGTGFQAVSKTGVVLGTYATEEEAKKNHRRVDIMPVETDIVRAREEEKTDKVAQLPEGYAIKTKTVAGESAPAAYVLREDGSPRNASQTFAEQIDAERHLDLLTRKREALAASEMDQAEGIRKKLEKQQTAIAQMEAEGKTDTAEHKNAISAFKAADVAASDRIAEHTEKAEALRQPLKIVPLGKKTAKVEKHTVTKNGKEIGTFTGDKGKTGRTKAEEHVLAQASEEELQIIADRGGVFGKRAETELQSRKTPGIRATTAGLEAAGVHTPEVEAKLAELKAKLLPMLKKFGLEQVGLNVIREIENNADGAWGRTDKLIRIALKATEPIKTMRHEALHALKELGFFTPQQWEALKRQAEKTWVNKYLKGVAFNDTMSRYDAYANGIQDENGKVLMPPLSAEDILEEAIADAFGDWEGGATPPPGLMAALFKRLQNFFSALRQALTGAGFESADEIFGKIERGELRAGKEAAGTETKMSLSGIGVPMSTRNLMEVQTPVAQQELGLNTEAKRNRFNSVRQIATALNEFTKAHFGSMNPGDLTNYEAIKIAKAIADEVGYQLRTTAKTGTGKGWYSNNYPNAVKLLANRFPELGTSQHARSVFSAIVAVTSNGERVAQNIANAIKLYSKLRDGKPMVAMSNRRSTALVNNLRTIHKLLDKHGEDFEKVLLKEITVKDMNAELKAMGEKADNSYLANTVVPAAAVYFGPKLGAFYANLSGAEGYLTMDLWWSRSINRMRGLLLPKATEASINKFRDMMGRPEATRDEVIAATIPLRDKYKDYGFNTELEHLTGSKEPKTNAEKPAWFKKAEQKAGDAYEQLLFDHNAEKMANTIYKNEYEMLEEAPFTGSDRKFMYDAARQAQDMLRKEGVDLSLADVQAALWYYEKRLYAKLSGRKADDIGYEEAIIAQSKQGNGRARPSVVFDREHGGGAEPGRESGKTDEIRGQPASTSTEQGVSDDNKYSIPVGKFTLRPGKGSGKKLKGSGIDGSYFVAPAGLGKTLAEHDTRRDREVGKRPNVEGYLGTGREFTGFFSNISLGFKGKPNAKPYEPTLNIEPIADFVREYNSHRGSFDDHIATSIPGFREVQTIVGDAIAKTYKNADMLDIGASEGALIKAVTKMSNGGVRTVALDPNFAMAKHFNDGEAVEGSVYDTSAFGTKADEGQLAWTEDATLTDRDGQVTTNPFAGEEVRTFKPDRQFDVIHEAMVFQFISGNRAAQIARAKELMKPDGVLIIEEKFVAGDQLSPEQFRANETQKDAYKEQYFTKAEIAAKAKAVGVAEKAEFKEKQDKKEQTVTGMNDLMVSPGGIEDVLSSNFDHVAQFWDSGNFKGYIASDSSSALENLVNNMLPTDSEFANVKTPRAVKYSLAPSDKAIVLGKLQPDAVEFPGVHYGNVQTDQLQASKYGTGIRGAERRRLENTDDQRIKNRVYFYIKRPDGTMPIPEAGVGHHVYTQAFKNILGPGKKMTEISKEAGGDFNYFESKIIDAGYDGYAAPDAGMMVILNHDVPVNYRGTRAELLESDTKLSLPTYFPTAEEAESAAYKAAPPGTAEFKRFFGASKAKEEGRAQPMFHASMEDFNIFRENRPIFISPDASFAEDFIKRRISESGSLSYLSEVKNKSAKIYPLWVRAETPFDYENKAHVQQIVNYLQANYAGWVADLGVKDLVKDLNAGKWTVVENSRTQEALKTLGFDSFHTAEGGAKNLAVFKANQVKSITGNLGGFDEGGDIRYSLREFKPDDLPKNNKPYTLPENTMIFHGAHGAAAKKIEEAGKTLLAYPGIKSSGGSMDEAGLIFFGGRETATDFANSRADQVMVEALERKEGKRLPGIVFETATDRPYKLMSRYQKLSAKEANELNAVLGLPDYKRLKAGDSADLASSRAYTNSRVLKEYSIQRGEQQLPMKVTWPVIFRTLGFDGFYDNQNVPAVALTANNGIKLIGDDGRLVKYSLPVFSAADEARVNETAQVREHKGVIARILDAFAPESLADLRASFIHRYNQLGVYDRKLAEKMGGKVLLADMSAEAAANMSDLSASVTYAAFGIGNRKGGIPVYKNGMTIVDTSTKGPLQILAPLAQFSDPKAYQHYQFWAGVKRGSRFLETGVEENYKASDIALAEKYRKAYMDKGVNFITIQKEMNTFNDGLVDYMVATGVLSKGKAAEFKRHMDYIPFYRQLNGEDTVGPKIFNSISGVKPPKKIKHSEAPLTDYLESIVQNTQAAINAGMKNMAAQRAISVAIQLGPIAGAQKLTAVNGAPDCVTVLENGEAVSYRVADQLFVNAVKSLNMVDMPWLGIFSAPSNVLRNLVTKDPGFMLANLARDSLSAWVTSGTNMTPIIGTAANFVAALGGKSPIYHALLNAGILGGYEFSSGVMRSAESFQKDLNKKYGSNKGALPLRAFKGVWEALEHGTEASDAATRMAVYERVLAETGNETEALYRALEVMNFNRKGSSPIARILTAAIPFLNARIQGLDVFYRTAMGQNVSANAKEMQRAFFVRGATLMALSAAYFLAVSDDDEWKKQEQETKDNYWIFPGVGKFPTPFEVGFLFKTVPERLMALTFKDDTSDDFKASMQRGLLNTFAFNPMPQVAKPIFEYNANYNFFTGRPIVGQGMEGLEAQYQIGPNTTKIAEVMGKALGMPPIKLDQLINSYTGTMGMYAMTVIDSVLDSQSNSPNASKRFEQLPILKRFAADPEARGNITQFYELKKAVDAAVQTENMLIKAGKPEEFMEFMEKNKGLLAIKPYVANIEKSMKQMREMRKMAQGAEMSGDEKRDTLTSVGQMENNLTANIQTVKKMISEL